MTAISIGTGPQGQSRTRSAREPRYGASTARSAGASALGQSLRKPDETIDSSVDHVFRNHVGWLYDSGSLVGYFNETETDELSKDGNSYETGIYDLSGNLQADVTGTAAATRILPWRTRKNAPPHG